MNTHCDLYLDEKNNVWHRWPLFRFWPLTTACQHHFWPTQMFFNRTITLQHPSISVSFLTLVAVHVEQHRLQVSVVFFYIISCSLTIHIPLICLWSFFPYLFYHFFISLICPYYSWWPWQYNHATFVTICLLISDDYLYCRDNVFQLSIMTSEY